MLAWRARPAACIFAGMTSPLRTSRRRPPAAAPASAGVDEALQLWVALARAHASVQAHAAADAARHGLTLAEFGVLEVLYHKGPLLLSEVQRKVLVSSGGITFLVNRLEERGLVERRHIPGDRRARHVALTAAGRRLVARIFPEHTEVIRRALGGLTVRERRDARRFLRTLGRAAAEMSLPGSELPAGE